MFELFGLGANFTFTAEGIENITNVVDRLNLLHSSINHLTTEGVQALSQAHTEMGNILVSMGQKSAFIGGIITAGVGFGIAQASKWENQMIDASRYMQDTSIEAQRQYNLQIKETAQLLGKSKDEINEATIAYMTMGKSEGDALRLAKNAGYAAVAWDMASGEVADSFRSIKAAFNINLEDQSIYQKYLDNINEVGNSTAAVSADVIRFLSDGGAALHNVANVSIEQAMGMASAARYANMSIAEFSTMMTRLGNQYAQDKSTKYFRELGVEVKTADGKMRSFAEVLHDVQKQWTTMDNETKSNFVSSVGGVYADRLSLYMGSGEEYEKGTAIASKDNSGSAQKEFERVTNTFSMAMSRLKTTLTDFGQAFWGTLLPTFTKIVNGVNMVASAISNFAQKHPMVMKVIASFITLSGVFLVVGGSVLMLSGFIHKLIGLMIAQGANAVSFFGKLISGVGMSFNILGQSIMLSIPKILSLGMSMGALYLAWKYDIFNIRSMVDNFIAGFKRSFSEAQTLLKSDMSLSDFRNKIQQLNNSNDVFDKIALGIAKVGLAFQGLKEYMSTGGLSDIMFDKLNEAGLMPIISIIIGLGMRFKALWDGISEGFTSAVDAMAQWLNNVLGPPLKWVNDNLLVPLAQAIFGVDENVQDLSSTVDGIQFVDLDAKFGKIETWKAIGRAIGIVAMAFVTLKTAMMIGTVGSAILSVIGTVGSVIATVGGAILGFAGTVAFAFGAVASGAATVGEAILFVFPFLGTIGSAIVGVFSGIVGLFSGIGSVLMGALTIVGTVVTAILGAVGIVVTAPAWVVGAIVAAVVAIGVAIFVFRDQIVEFFTVTIPEAFSNAWNAVTGFFEQLPEMIGYGLGFLVGTLFNFFTVTLPEAFNNGLQALQQWGNDVLNFLTVDVPNFFVSCGESIANFFTSTLPEAFNNGLQALQQWGSDVLNFLTVDVPNFFLGLPEQFSQFATDCIDGLVNGWNNMIDTAVQAITDFVNGFIQGFKDAAGINSPSTVFEEFGGFIIEGLINGITNFVGGAVDAITGVATSIADGFKNAVSGAVEWGSGVVNSIGNGVSGAVSFASGAISTVGNTVKDTWNNSILKGAIDWGADTIKNVASGISRADNIPEAVSNVSTTLKTSFDTLKSSAVSWGSNMVSGFISGINSMKESVGSAVAGITQKAKQFIGFHSPSEKGEGQHIVEWGSNMVSGFCDGIIENSDLVSETMEDVITNPVSDVLGNKSRLPISARISSSQELSLDSMLNTYLSKMVTLLTEISFGIRSAIGGTSITSANGSISNNPIDKATEMVQKVVETSTATNSKILQVNINHGAIHNEFNIGGNGNTDKQTIINMLMQVLDDELMPMIVEKINEMQIAYNE